MLWCCGFPPFFVIVTVIVPCCCLCGGGELCVLWRWVCDEWSGSDRTRVDWIGSLHTFIHTCIIQLWFCLSPSAHPILACGARGCAREGGRRTEGTNEGWRRKWAQWDGCMGRGDGRRRGGTGTKRRIDGHCYKYICGTGCVLWIQIVFLSIALRFLALCMGHFMDRSVVGANGRTDKTDAEQTADSTNTSQANTQDKQNS